MLQDSRGLASRVAWQVEEKIELTFTLLFNGLFFKMMNAFGM